MAQTPTDERVTNGVGRPAVLQPMPAAAHEVLDQALESISWAAPELVDGFPNHAPMTIEALCAMGRAEAVFPWLDKYRNKLISMPPMRERISRREWHTAFGQIDRMADWKAFFENELKEAPWTQVLDQWVVFLSPGISGAATHGVIRTGHAVRSLTVCETRARLQELSSALAYWAATFEVLPLDLSAKPQATRPQEAILNVPVVPKELRTFSGSINASFKALGKFKPFGPVIHAADLEGDLTEVLSALTETFGQVYLANAQDCLSATIFVHGITSIAAVRSLSPILSALTASRLVRYAWQSACALYSVFGLQPRPEGDIREPQETFDVLMDMAVSNGDEHAIKITEVCARESSFNPSPVYRCVARHALDVR